MGGKTVLSQPVKRIGFCLPHLTRLQHHGLRPIFFIWVLLTRLSYSESQETLFRHSRFKPTHLKGTGRCSSFSSTGSGAIGITVATDDYNIALGSKVVATLMPKFWIPSRFHSRFQPLRWGVVNGPFMLFIKQQRLEGIAFWCCQFSATKGFPSSSRDCGKRSTWFENFSTLPSNWNFLETIWE